MLDQCAALAAAGMAERAHNVKGLELWQFDDVEEATLIFPNVLAQLEEEVLQVLEVAAVAQA